VNAFPFDDPSALAPPRTERTDLGGGSFLLRHPEPLRPHARCIGDWLERWAAEKPSHPFLCERDTGGGWR
jgi:feruloyl-CoA synthase